MSFFPELGFTAIPPERCKETSRKVIIISRLSQEMRLHAHQTVHFVLFPRLVKIIKTAHASKQNLEIPGLIQLDIRGRTWPSSSTHSTHAAHAELSLENEADKGRG